MNAGTRTAVKVPSPDEMYLLAMARSRRIVENIEGIERDEADMRADAESTLARCAWDTLAKKHARDVLALLERLEGERKHG